MMKLGDDVVLTRQVKLVRKVDCSRKVCGVYKSWEEEAFALGGGIFLGYRHLQNGVRTNTDYGCEFAQDETVKVALICYSATRNPIYVPADAIELASKAA